MLDMVNWAGGFTIGLCVGALVGYIFFIMQLNDEDN